MTLPGGIRMGVTDLFLNKSISDFFVINISLRLAYCHVDNHTEYPDDNLLSFSFHSNEPPNGSMIYRIGIKERLLWIVERHPSKKSGC